MQRKLITIAGGLLIAISMFLPFGQVLSKSVTGLQMQGPAKFFIVLGIAIAAIGYLDKKKSYIGSLIAGLIVVLLSMKYQSDMRKYGDVGIGLWMMLAGGLLSIAGSAIGAFGKSKTTTAS